MVILPAPGEDARMATSRCSGCCPGSLPSGAAKAIDEGEALDQNLDMSAGRLGGSRCHGDRRRAQARQQLGDRQSVVSGKSVSVRVDLGGRRLINKTINTRIY